MAAMSPAMVQIVSDMGGHVCPGLQEWLLASDVINPQICAHIAGDLTEATTFIQKFIDGDTINAVEH